MSDVITFLYDVAWHTRPSPGCTYYSGCERVMINAFREDEWSEFTEVAKEKALRQIIRRAFMNATPNRFEITQVNKPVS